ncbi:MAG TPA: hypothetical protein PLN52_25035 [Opitutaceae bacterium]|nr:hypothetical protein [Opitutaceae bacterium]
MTPMKPMEPLKPVKRWWPEDLGDSPNSAGGQNSLRYAFFGDRQRLALDKGDGAVRIYDTGSHRVSGVQQQQAGGRQKVVFTSQEGQLDLETLKEV